MTIERINHLFQEGSITSEEHNELINMKITGKTNSLYGYLTLLFALAGFLSMLTFTKGDETIFSIFSTQYQKAWAGMIFSVLGLGIFAYSKFRHQKTYYHKEHCAYIGIGIITSVQMILLPGLLF